MSKLLTVWVFILSYVIVRIVASKLGWPYFDKEFHYFAGLCSGLVLEWIFARQEMKRARYEEELKKIK